MVTDIDTGKTQQYYCPDEVPQSDPFGALMASNGKFYHSQGSWLVEFDPVIGEFTFHGIPSKTANTFLCFTEDTQGRIWAGAVYGTELISYDPETHEMIDHGRMDSVEKYAQYLAADAEGWIYMAIGTARQNIIAYNPTTHEKRQLIPEDERQFGSALVYPSENGVCYGAANGKRYQLFDGTAEETSETLPSRNVGSLKYGSRSMSFPDGRKCTSYDAAARKMTIIDSNTGEIREIAFDYGSEGASITSLAAGPGDIIYASTCHPMHLVSLDLNADKLTDMGPVPKVGGGNYCAITTNQELLFGAEYAGGRLWAYAPTLPWNPNGTPEPLAITPAKMQAIGNIAPEDGHFSLINSESILFIHGDRYGARASFKLKAPINGRYYLYIQTYQHDKYDTVQFYFDGKPVGNPYIGFSDVTDFGPMLEFGPFDLKPGEYALAAEMIKGDGPNPWIGICSIDLTTQRRVKANIKPQNNPRILGQWSKDVCRPRTILMHPDERHIIMAGYAGYGRCGGGIGIVDLATNQDTLLTADENLLPGHSCITLKALPNGDLVGGTSIAAPGGGHTTATEAEIFIIDWKTKEITFAMVPVPGETYVKSIWVMPDGLVYGLTVKGWFFVFDPIKKEIVHTEDLTSYGGVPRHALQQGPDGNLYAMFGWAIVRISPGTFEHQVLAKPPVGIQAGGAFVGNRLVFANGSHLWSYKIPGLN